MDKRMRGAGDTSWSTEKEKKWKHMRQDEKCQMHAAKYKLY